MKVEELVYGYKGNETYLTLYLSKVSVEDLKTLQHRAGVYMIYSKEDELMYVGETTSIPRRMANHLSPNHSKKEITKESVGYILYAYLKCDRYERSIIEGLLVHKYQPALNCNDEMRGDASSKVDKAVQYDALYYARNTDIRSFVIARALNVDNEYINSIRNYGCFNHSELPNNYIPKVIITQEFIDNAVISREPINQTVFNQIRELIEEGSMKKVEIARKFGISPASMTRMYHLDTNKYRKWEEQRTGKAVA